MSPVGGVGINLAIADAVAAAGIWQNRFGPAGSRPSISPRYVGAESCPPLSRRRCNASCTAVLLAPVLQGHEARPPAALVQLVERVPQLTAVPAYIVGVGLLPQHAPDFARR